MTLIEVYLVLSWAACLVLIRWQSLQPSFRSPLGVAAMVLEFVAAPVFMMFVLGGLTYIAAMFALFETLNLLMPDGTKDED